jgi:hypothetical protein
VGISTRARVIRKFAPIWPCRQNVVQPGRPSQDLYNGLAIGDVVFPCVWDIPRHISFVRVNSPSTADMPDRLNERRVANVQSGFQKMPLTPPFSAPGAHGVLLAAAEQTPRSGRPDHARYCSGICCTRRLLPEHSTCLHPSYLGGLLRWPFLCLNKHANRRLVSAPRVALPLRQTKALYVRRSSCMADCTND